MSEQNGLTEEQKNFLQGFAMGADVAAPCGRCRSSPGAGRPGPVGGGGEPRAGRGRRRPRRRRPARSGSRSRPRTGPSPTGKTLCKEEQAKRDKDPLTM